MPFAFSKRVFYAALLFFFVGACDGATHEISEEDLAGPPTPDTTTTCETTEITIETGYLEGVHPDPWYLLDQPAHVSNGELYFQRGGTSFSNAADDLELVRWRPGTDIQQLTANDVDERMIAGLDGGLLFARAIDAETDQLIYLSQDQHTETELSRGGHFRASLEDAYSSAESVTVRKDRAVWLQDNAVWYFDGQTSRVLTESLVQPSRLYLGKDAVVWSAREHEQGDFDVFVWTADKGVRQLTNDEHFEQGLMVSEQHVFWNVQGALVAWSFDDETIQTLGERCSVDTVEGNNAIIACFDDQLSAHTYVWFDGQTQTPVPTTGAALFSPRLDGQRLAWFEYDDPDAMCYPNPDVPGRLMLWTLGDSADPVEIDKVGAGCWCCNAFWPAHYLRFDGGLLVWNYVWPGESSHREPHPTVGWASVRERCQ